MNGKLLNVGLFTALLLVTVAAIAGVTQSQKQRQIPAAAAAEANIVCTSFQGLQRFVVEPMPSASSPDGELHRYRVTATCKSEHIITGVIGLDEKETADE